MPNKLPYKSMGRPPKFDYNGDEFYEEIYALAMQGLTDAEIAFALGERFGQTLNPDVFGSMKNGNYAQWSKRQNEERGMRINRVLARARAKINSIVRGAYLKSALGGKKISSKVVSYVRQRCHCQGNDEHCPDCGGTGYYYLTDKQVVQESESELPPNQQAMSTWLFHHDPEWRKLQRGQDDEGDLIKDGQGGIDVDKWIIDHIEESSSDD